MKTNLIKTIGPYFDGMQKYTHESFCKTVLLVNLGPHTTNSFATASFE